MLVILGLNISNQGMNSLTMQSRLPVVGLQTQGESISIFTLGESHSYAKQAIASELIQAKDRVRSFGQVISNYVLRIAEIVKVFLLS